MAKTVVIRDRVTSSNSFDEIRPAGLYTFGNNLVKVVLSSLVGSHRRGGKEGERDEETHLDGSWVGLTKKSETEEIDRDVKRLN